MHGRLYCWNLRTEANMLGNDPLGELSYKISLPVIVLALRKQCVEHALDSRVGNALAEAECR
jgi:hypothetical protein